MSLNFYSAYYCGRVFYYAVGFHNLPRLRVAGLPTASTYYTNQKACRRPRGVEASHDCPMSPLPPSADGHFPGEVGAEESIKGVAFGIALYGTLALGAVTTVISFAPSSTETRASRSTLSSNSSKTAIDLPSGDQSRGSSNGTFGSPYSRRGSGVPCRLAIHNSCRCLPFSPSPTARVNASTRPLRQRRNI